MVCDGGISASALGDLAVGCFLCDLEVAAFMDGAPCLALLGCVLVFVSETALFTEIQGFSVSLL